MLTNADINTNITITKGTESVSGMLISIFNSPELRDQLSGGTQGVYTSAWSSGSRVIAVRVDITTLIVSSSILNSIVGVTEYVIKGEIYSIQSINMLSTGAGTGTTSKDAVITLRHRQGNSEYYSQDISLKLTYYPYSGVGDQTYTCTDLVEGAPITLTSDYKISTYGSCSVPDFTSKLNCESAGETWTVPTPTPPDGVELEHQLDFEFYKFGPDDVFFQDWMNSTQQFGGQNRKVTFRGFELTKIYQETPTSPTYTEVIERYSGDSDYLITQYGLPKISINSGTGKESLKYSLTIPDNEYPMYQSPLNRVRRTITITP